MKSDKVDLIVTIAGITLTAIFTIAVTFAVVAFGLRQLGVVGQ